MRDKSKMLALTVIKLITNVLTLWFVMGGIMKQVKKNIYKI